MNKRNIFASFLNENIMEKDYKNDASVGYQEGLIVCTPAQLRAIIEDVIRNVPFSSDAKLGNGEEERFLTPKEVCGILGVCPKTLQNLRDQRRIPFCQQGRKIWFKKSDVLSYLDACKISSRR